MSGIWARPFSTPKTSETSKLDEGPKYGPNPIAETIRFSAIFHIITLFSDLVGNILSK